eukprot:464460-Rhodomonas_salina.1
MDEGGVLLSPSLLLQKKEESRGQAKRKMTTGQHSMRDLRKALDASNNGAKHGDVSEQFRAGLRSKELGYPWDEALLAAIKPKSAESELRVLVKKPFLSIGFKQR